MNPGGILFLGFRYLARHRGKTALLVAAITISLVLPLGISLVVREAEAHLRARAESTPLILGATGSPMELVFGGLYFSKPDIATFPAGDLKETTRDRLATAIPLDARFQAQGHPIVGTSLDYFRFRDLEVAEGQMLRRLGDCLLGAGAANELGLGTGDTLISTPTELFDIAGVYPLRMRIMGVFEPTGTPDDDAVFVDQRTVWIIDGTSHGHIEADETAAEERLESGDDSTVRLNASVQQFNEVNDENIASFHPHGDPDSFPLTSAILLPEDRKAETILLGRFEAEGLPTQLIRPREVMDDLFSTVFRIRDLVVVALAAVGLCAVFIAGLVFLLSNRLREREFESLVNLGAGQWTVRFLLVFEAGFVLLTSLVLAAGLLMLLQALTPMLLQGLTG